MRQITLKSSYDLVIVGGGIQGCALLWEAQSRGLSALLVEQHDYCSQTSTNSLKTIHGGIRYLQSLNLIRTWRSSKEPEILLSIAPHLVHQLACLLPTEKSLKRSRLAVTAGFHFYNLIKKFSCREQQLPSARCLTKSQLNARSELLDVDKVTGAGLWYDAQVQHAERLGQAFIATAKRAGADAYSYLKASSISKSANETLSVLLSDQLGQQSSRVAARSVVFCTASRTLKNLDGFINPAIKSAGDSETYPKFCMALNLVVNEKYSNFAIGLQSGFASQNLSDSSRLLFSAPWRNSTMFGTWYFEPQYNDDGECAASEAQINFCLADINNSYPQLSLKRNDIVQVHAGLLPLAGTQSEPAFNLQDHDLISQPDDTLNVYTVIPAKFTTCRVTAEKVVDLLSKNIQQSVSPSISAKTPLADGEIDSDFSTFTEKCQQQFIHLLPAPVIDQLCLNYGSRINEIISLCQENDDLLALIPGSADHIKAQLHYELEQGNVFKLEDFTQRRSFLSVGPQLDKQTIQYCSEQIMRFHSAVVP